MTERSSGILLPISSLPSRYGIGTLGREAYQFADALKAAHQTYWQVLPLGPTSFGDSPYQSFSTFAGNPYFIDLELLAEDGLADLDAPLGTYWGEEVRDPYAQTQPSIRTLMAHASGLKDFGVTRGLSKLRGTLSSSSAWRNVEPGTPEAWYSSNFGVRAGHHSGAVLWSAAGQLFSEPLPGAYGHPGLSPRREAGGGGSGRPL